MEEILIGVMDLQEAKNHQLKLKNQGIALLLKTNDETCHTGCKVKVEVWGRGEDQDTLSHYFRSDFMKHVQGHAPNLDHMSAVFDTSAAEVTCQACGMKFAPTASECPDCGLCY